MKMNWTAIIMTVLTAFVGLACVVIALTLAKDNATASGGLFGVAGAALGAFIKQPQKVGGSTSEGATPRAESDGGFAHPVGIVFLTLLTIAVVFAIALLVPLLARADVNNPSSGGCAIYEPNADGTACVPAIATATAPAVTCVCKLSFQAAIVVPAVRIDLTHGEVSGGTSNLGACYGFTYAPAQWYQSGVDYCLSANVSTSVPNTFSPLTIMAHLADYGSFGGGLLLTQANGAFEKSYWLFFAPRLSLTGN